MYFVSVACAFRSQKKGRDLMKLELQVVVIPPFIMGTRETLLRSFAGAARAFDR